MRAFAAELTIFFLLVISGRCRSELSRRLWDAGLLADHLLEAEAREN
jgi:hypothetical protein